MGRRLRVLQARGRRQGRSDGQAIPGVDRSHARQAGLKVRMPSRSAQIVQVGKRTIELSNLTKVLYPDDHIVKAQLIEYYLKIAPSLLAHVKGRPLSLVRYPDGIGGESFFQKNKPKWAPDWLESVTLGE